MLANIVYFDDAWQSTKEGRGEAKAPTEFSLPLQYITGHMFAKYNLPSLELKVRPLDSVHDHQWDERRGSLSGGVVTHSGTDTEVSVELQAHHVFAAAIQPPVPCTGAPHARACSCPTTLAGSSS